MKLNRLTLKDRALFNRFLGLKPHGLSVYAFANIYIWKGLFKIYWALIEGALCVFFQDKVGCFLYLPPLAKKIKPIATEQVFKVMDKFNCQPGISRIENVEEPDLAAYRKLGYAVEDKSVDYLCCRRDLAALSGNKFKSQRAARNYFIKHYVFEYLPFRSQDAPQVLTLHSRWAVERRAKFEDPVYQGMLEDSRKCLKILLGNWHYLGIVARVVKVAGKLKAFTCGFPLNRKTFCILYEIADLEVKGIAQFIFQRFSAELKGYTYINIMDDSGLENLKQVKLAYHPQHLIPAYIIQRSYA